MQKLLSSLAGVVAFLVLPLVALAQVKPAVVVSIASVSESLSDIGYITRAAGVPDAGKTAVLFGSAFTQGIDKSKPIGIFVSPADGDFQAVVAVPVTNLKELLATFKEQIGDPRDAGDGILEVGNANTFFVKQVGTWAFAAQQVSHLQKLPEDPAALLGDLPRRFNVAVQVNVQNIPKEYRQLAIDEIKSGFERAAEQGGGGDLDAELRERVSRNSLQQVIDLIEQADQLTVGLQIDPMTKKTFFDIEFTALPGSKRAQVAELNATPKSSFTGFLQPEAALSLNFSGKMAADEIETIKLTLKDLRTRASKEIDNDPNLDAKSRGAAKEVLATLFDVLGTTLDGGKLDGGAVVLLDKKSIDFAAGGLLSDGVAIENAFKKLVDLSKNDPEFPAVKLDAGQHAGVKFHTLTAKVPDREGEARELFGDKIDIVLGTGPKSLFVAFGKQAEPLLKRIIDQSATGVDEPQPVMQLTFALLPFLKFASSVDPNPVVAEMAATLEKVAGSDKIRVRSKSIPRGESTRLEIDEGLLQLIGVGVKQAGVRLPGGRL